jgi:hypothetical protein
MEFVRLSDSTHADVTNWFIGRKYRPASCCYGARPKVVVEHDGRAQSIAAWAEEAGLETNVLANRLARGWDTSRALATPTVAG